MSAGRKPDPEREALRSFTRRIDPADPGAHNNLGVFFFRKKLFDDAIAAFQRALQLDPKMTVARRNLEVAYRETGFYERRVAELRRKLEADPDDADARWELGRHFAAMGDVDTAAAEFATLIAKRPENVAAMMQLAAVEKARGNYEAATRWLERAGALDETSSVIHQQLGEVLYNRARYAEAEAALRRAIDLNADNAEAYYQLAFVLGDLGRHEEARSAAARALELNPGLGRARTNLSLDTAALGRAATREMPSEAAREVDRTASAEAHYDLGTAFRRRGLFKQALAEYRLALETGENRERVLEAMAETHLLDGDYRTAYDELGMVLAEDVDTARVWNERGVAAHQLGRIEEAIDCYRKALGRDPSYGFALNNLSVALVAGGREDEALEALERSVELESTSSVPALNFGLLLLRLGHLQRALQTFRGVLDSEQHSALAWNGIGLVLIEIGRIEDARNAFARAVETDPRSAEAHYNLSFALSRMGDYDGALRAVTAAQRIDPYYIPQRFRLLTHVAREDPRGALVSEITADVREALEREGFVVDPGDLDELFMRLEQVPARPPERPDTAALELARDYLTKGFLELATAEATRALSRGADPAEANQLLGDILAARGLHGEALERYRAAIAAAPDRLELKCAEIGQLIHLSRATEALERATRLAQQHPGEAGPQLALAEARLARGDAAGALEALREARKRAPHRADLLRLEGAIAVKMGDYETASTAYRAALDLDPHFLEARLGLAAVHVAREEWDAAEAHYRAALKTAPTVTAAAVALADLHRRRGKPRAAIDLLVDVLAANPADLDALLALGRALLDDGRVSEAGEAFRRLLAHDQRNVGAHFFAGVVLAREKRYSGAVRHWEEVVRLDPGGPFAQRAITHARTARDLKRIFQTEAA